MYIIRANFKGDSRFSVPAHYSYVLERDLLGRADRPRQNISLFYVFTTILATYQNSEKYNLYGISSPYGNDHKHFGI
jgi:hypothetical protein